MAEGGADSSLLGVGREKYLMQFSSTKLGKSEIKFRSDDHTAKENYKVHDVNQTFPVTSTPRPDKLGTSSNRRVAADIADKCLRAQGRCMDNLSSEVAKMFVRNCQDTDLAGTFKVKPLENCTAKNIPELLDSFQHDSKLRAPTNEYAIGQNAQISMHSCEHVNSGTRESVLMCFKQGSRGSNDSKLNPKDVSSLNRVADMLAQLIDVLKKKEESQDDDLILETNLIKHLFHRLKGSDRYWKLISTPSGPNSKGVEVLSMLGDRHRWRSEEDLDIVDFALDMENGKQWVVLVAGSKGWDDYRHQANVCHAYQMMRQNGIPDDQIVVMMYDDIAYNEKNPYHGNIINKPNGPNVYPGVLKDYTGTDVTPENFLAALKGDRSAVKKTNPKVITSGRKDKIFIYMTDHGSSGLFCFPNHKKLSARDLIETIKEMARDKKFSKMVIYMESCKSGSMFTELPNNIHVYAVTSTKPEENCYACYYDTERKTHLSDEFSSVWMQHSEKENIEKVTFQDQFDYLQKEMKKSCPCQFGDMTIGKRPISEFLKNTLQTVRQTSEAQMLTDLTSYHELLKLQIQRIQVLIKNYQALYKTRTKM